MISSKLIFHKFFFISVSLTIFFIGGIEKQINEIDIYPALETKQKITFDKDIKPIMNTYCGGVFCHHGKPSAWTKYEIIKKSVDSGIFHERVIEKRNMPKRKPLPEKEYNLIKIWIENGAIEK